MRELRRAKERHGGPQDTPETRGVVVGLLRDQSRITTHRINAFVELVPGDGGGRGARVMMTLSLRKFSIIPSVAMATDGKSFGRESETSSPDVITVSLTNEN